MKNKTAFIVILALLMLLTAALCTQAQSNKVYHLKLLAVQESPDGKYLGSPADLYLEIREGTGRVFIDTFPLTKLDTQVSTRFAKEIACKYYDLNCDKYDFIYTIKAQSSIIGGPSAGAATSALTAVALLGLNYDENIAITGTINSGATIGPVGGLKEKIEAAKESKATMVILPKGTAQQKIGVENFFGNATLSNQSSLKSNQSLGDYGTKTLGLKISEAADLDEVLFILTGKKVAAKEAAITQNAEYEKIMKNLQQILCQRTGKIESELRQSLITINPQIREEVDKKKAQAEEAIKTGDFYSAASFCFGNNIALKNEYYLKSGAKIGVINSLFSNLGLKADELDAMINSEKVTTISGLQARMIVKERINDARHQIQLFEENKDKLPIEQLYPYLSYAEERLYSALSWMQFFTMEGKEFDMDKDVLEESCQLKLSEAEERLQYAGIYFGVTYMQGIQENIGKAKDALGKEEFELCLMEATQAKAEANAILSSIGVGEENFDSFIASKLKAVEKVIAENSAEGVFPILGYSYYQYAKSLQEQDKYMSLVYLEYALEMSDLEMYFPPQEKELFGGTYFWESDSRWEGLLVGVIIGIAATLLVIFLKNPKEKVVEEDKPKKKGNIKKKK